MIATQSCKSMAAQMGEYVTGQLNPEEARVIEDHVVACRTCGAEVKRLRAVNGLILNTLVGRGTEPAMAERTGKWVAAALSEDISDTAPLANSWGQRLGAMPWWFVSCTLHVLVIALAGLITMAIELPRSDDGVIIVTELSRSPTLDQDNEKPRNPESALDSKPETAPTDPTSKEASDIVIPPDILAKAELGDHFETINTDLPDTHGALGNPDAKMFHSVTGNTEAAGGGGAGGVGMEDTIGIGGASSRGSGGGFGGGDGGGIGNQSGAGKGSFGNRNGGGRKLMVKRHGGSAATESAVDKALEWLAYHQEADGHWEISKYGAAPMGGCVAYNEGVSALALLAFLGAGHTDKVGAYKDNVTPAAKWLIGRQLADGSFSAFGNGTSDYHIYDTALTTLALSELYGMTRDSEFKTAVGASAQKGIDWLYKIQQSTSGGWYHGHYGKYSSISLTGWVIMAMKSAKVAKLKVPPQMFEGAIKCLNAAADKDAAGYYTKVGYTDEPNSRYRYAYHKGYTTSAIGLVCLEFTGMGNQADELGGYISEVLPRWDNADRLEREPGADTPPQNFYHWYYSTLALFQQGGDRWKKWNEALKTALVPSQCKDGDNAGSWPAERAWESTGGRVFTTALGALSLEVYYRYEKLSH